MTQLLDFFVNLIMALLGDLRLDVCDFLIKDLCYIQLWLFVIIWTALEVELEVVVDFWYLIKHHAVESKRTLPHKNIENRPINDFLSFVNLPLEQPFDVLCEELEQMVYTTSLFNLVNNEIWEILQWKNSFWASWLYWRISQDTPFTERAANLTSAFDMVSLRFHLQTESHPRKAYHELF